MFCENCGKKLEGNERFCRSCGCEVKVPVEVPVEVQMQGNPSKKQTQKKGKKGIVKFGIAVVVLTVVVVAGSGIVTYRSKMKEAEKIVKNDQTELKNKKSGTKEQVKEDSETVETVALTEAPTVPPTEIPTVPPTIIPTTPPAETYVAPVAEAAAPVLPEENVSVPVPQSTTSEYVIENSDSVYLTRGDIAHLSLQEINYAKNEIYARHGRKFVSPELQNHFNGKSWYYGSIDSSAFSDTLLNDYEIANAALLAEVEFSISPNGYQLDQ